MSPAEALRRQSLRPQLPPGWSSVPPPQPLEPAPPPPQRPRYGSSAQRVLARLEAAVGGVLPYKSALAMEMDMSNDTLSHALKSLTEEGALMVRTRAGKWGSESERGGVWAWGGVARTRGGGA